MINKILDIAALTAGAFLVLLVLAAKGPALMDRDTLIVTGGSMEPAIALGSAIVVQPADPKTFKGGEVISYVDRSESFVTHRIIEVVTDDKGLGFRTQGDANRTADPELVRPKNVLGEVWYSVPLAGYLLHAMAQPMAKAGLMGAVFAILAWQFLQGNLRRPQPKLATAGLD